MRAWLRRRGRLRRLPVVPEPTLRAALYSADQMERYGKTLAMAHRLTDRRVHDRLLPRLAANETVLIGLCNSLTAAASSNQFAVCDQTRCVL